MISSITTMNVASYTGNVSGVASNGKLVVPVSPAFVIYSQFEHVSGVAAQQPDAGVNVSKVRILNTLIDKLVEMKQQPALPEDESELSEKQVDALIKDYQKQIDNAISSAQTNPYALQGATRPESGALFSIAS